MNAIPYDRPEEDWDKYEDDDYAEAQRLPGRPRRQFLTWASAALCAVVLCAAGFYAGVRVEKGQVSSSSTTTLGATGAGARAAGAGAAAGRGAAGSGARAAGATALFGGSGGGAGAFAGAGAASPSSTGASTSGSATARRAALVACLKSHGVTLPASPPGTFKPPSGTGGTSTTPRPGGVFRSNPNMQAALKACGANFGRFGGGRFLGRISHVAVQNYAMCLRQHGVNVPAPNFSGNGPTFPASIRSKPKFPAATKACQHLLVPPQTGGGTGTTSSA